jgi:glycerol-3-phosphate acyltransferase PlsY
MMDTLIWVTLSFLSGSIPFAVWLGRLFLARDIRAFGDGNPGATNVFRAGSPALGVISLILDVGKAALPVGICYFQLGFQGLAMFAIAIAPILGHMFSPFLGFKGGKALAAALGVWIGLSTWQLSLPAILGVVLGILIFSRTGWAVMLSMVFIFLTTLIWLPQPLYFWVWAAETSLLAWTHRSDLIYRPELHRRILKLIARDKSP